MTPFATSDNNEYAVQEIVMNFIFSKVSLFLSPKWRYYIYVQGAIVNIDEKTGKAVSIERVKEEIVHYV